MTFLRTHLGLTESETNALAQFVKRISHTDILVNASSVEEANQIRTAINKIQKTLASEGYAPR